MSRYVVTNFVDEDGAKLTGLHPTITIRKVVDNAVVINAVAMTEMSDGFYKYLFTTYDSEIPYTFLCDSGVDMVGRYAMSASVIDLEDKVDDLQTSVDTISLGKGVISFDSTE